MLWRIFVVDKRTEKTVVENGSGIIFLGIVNVFDYA